jgi:hypothetical protein
MPNGRPGDSRHHDIVHHRIETFGPACDELVREITARLPPERMGEVQDIIEPWPWNDDGTPRDPDALFHRLAAFRDGLAAERRAERRAKRRPGRATLVALAAFLLGGTAIGLATGVAAFAIGAALRVSQFEGAFAMGVAALMPLAGITGGLVLALWLGYRTLRGGR